MSEYKFCCSHCGQHLAGTEEWAGRMLQCPSCQREFQAPQLAAPPPSLRIAGATPSEVPPVLPAQSELERQVLAGGRFVIFQYCISVLVMTFKRSSAITFIQPGGDGAGPAITHSLISLLVGWWGIPWGPIWTISSVIKNARGGTDVTQAVLTEQLGPGRAAQIMAQRHVVPPNGWGLKVFRWGLAGFALLLLLFVALPFVMAFSSASSRYSNRTFAPGEAEFRAANNQIGVNRGGVAFGNSPKAIAVANQFSTSMKTLRQTQFEGGKPGGASLSGHEFITYCELRDAECAIIVHVPELRRYKLGSKRRWVNWRGKRPKRRCVAKALSAQE